MHQGVLWTKGPVNPIFCVDMLPTWPSSYQFESVSHLKLYVLMVSPLLSTYFCQLCTYLWTRNTLTFKPNDNSMQSWFCDIVFYKYRSSRIKFLDLTNKTNPHYTYYIRSHRIYYIQHCLWCIYLKALPWYYHLYLYVYFRVKCMLYLTT